MHTVIIAVHLMIVSVLIGAVLLQKSEGGGLGMGGGAGFMSSRGTANLLTRTTAILAVGFFLTSLTLSWLATLERRPTSLINSTTSAPAQPGAPAAPLSQGGGVLDALRQSDQQQQQQAPSAPEAPRSK